MSPQDNAALINLLGAIPVLDEDSNVVSPAESAARAIFNYMLSSVSRTSATNESIAAAIAMSLVYEALYQHQVDRSSVSSWAFTVLAIAVSGETDEPNNADDNRQIANEIRSQIEKAVECHPGWRDLFRAAMHVNSSIGLQLSKEAESARRIWTSLVNVIGDDSLEVHTDIDQDSISQIEKVDDTCKNLDKSRFDAIKTLSFAQKLHASHKWSLSHQKMPLPSKKNGMLEFPSFLMKRPI